MLRDCRSICLLSMSMGYCLYICLREANVTRSIKFPFVSKIVCKSAWQFVLLSARERCETPNKMSQNIFNVGTNSLNRFAGVHKRSIG